MGIVNQYPYTDMHSINLDYIIKLCRENMGLHLEISGNQLILKTADGTIVSSVTVHYAEEAGHAATATSATSAASATNATNAQNATYATNAAHAVAADSATVAATANQANSATTATSAANADYATTAGTAATATRATSAATADYATTTGNVEHADKAFENVENVGVGLKFTTYDGTNKYIVVGHADAALTDYDNRIIGRTYVSQVVEGDNGQIIFKTPYNDVVATITPTSASAASDTYGNTIADYVKTISAPNDSNYVTVSHGTGTAETLTVNYSNQAWKDTNGNVIKNTYVKDLECVEDENDGHYKLVAYNGDNPQAELFRTELKAYSAQVADEAAHAVTADTATTAQSSTGSVSSISVTRNIFTISNGDGSTQNVNMFRACKVYLSIMDGAGNTNLFNSSFTVGHSEEFTCVNYSNWNYNSAILAIRSLGGIGIELHYGTNSGAEGCDCPIYCFQDNNSKKHFLINVFDMNTASMKVFEIDEPADVVTDPGNLTITRLL